MTGIVQGAVSYVLPFPGLTVLCLHLIISADPPAHSSYTKFIGVFKASPPTIYIQHFAFPKTSPNTVSTTESRRSKHNIYSVQCRDCTTDGYIYLHSQPKKHRFLSLHHKWLYTYVTMESYQISCTCPYTRAYIPTCTYTKTEAPGFFCFNHV